MNSGIIAMVCRGFLRLLCRVSMVTTWFSRSVTFNLQSSVEFDSVRNLIYSRVCENSVRFGA